MVKLYMKILKENELISLIFSADCFLTLIQGFIDNEIVYIYIAASMGTAHLGLFIIEHFCRFKRWELLLFFNVVKGLMQLCLGYFLHPAWLAIVGAQIIILIKSDQNQTKLYCFFFFCAQIILMAFKDREFIILGCLRCFLIYILISQIFQATPCCSMNFTNQLCKSVYSNLICILDNNFEPIVQNISFSTLLESQVIQLYDFNFHSYQKILTPRDQNTQPINSSAKGMIHYDEDVSLKKIPFLTCLEHLKEIKKIHQITFKKLAYSLSDNQNIIIETVEDVKEYYLVYRIEKQEKKIDDLDLVMKSVHKVSHDMRTPLNAIINMQMCLKDLIDPDLADRYLKPSLNSCKLLLNLLNDILDSAQMKNKKIRLVMRKFNLIHLIEKTIQIFDIQKEKKELHVDYHYESKLPIKIYSDKNRIKQVLMNLISNAFKYTSPKGQILVDCQPGCDQKSIIISVSDTGMGIKEENLKTLFQDFSKVDDQENRIKNPNGVGLGLQISNDLAKLLGPNKGQGIQVTSTYRSGSRFSFEIENLKPPVEDLSGSFNDDKPIQQMDDYLEYKFIDQMAAHRSPQISVAMPQYESSRKIGTGASKYNSRAQNFQMMNSVHNQTLKMRTFDFEKSFHKKASNQGQTIEQLVKFWNDLTNGNPPVLIVDDNEFNIIVLQYILEQLGILSESSMSGMNALAKVNDRGKLGIQYQLIFLDIEMPVMDGIETARKIRDCDPNLKIIACSAYRVDNIQIDQYKEIGIMGAIEKPVTKQHLKELLQQIAETGKPESQQFSHYF